MDENTRTVKARVTVYNKERKLKPGMFCRVNLKTAFQGKGLFVSKKAVLTDEGENFVFVKYTGDYFLKRGVKQGEEKGEKIELLEGVTENQEVVNNGAFLLKSDILRGKMGAGCAD